MFTYSVWIPSQRLHVIKELHKLAKAKLAGKPYTLKPFQHTKGRISGSMQSDAYAEAVATIRKAGLPYGVAKPIAPERSYFDGRSWITQSEYEAREAQREFYKDRPDYFERSHFVNDPAQYDRDYEAALAEWNDREIEACGMAEAA